jgi:uncharacterized membrane protein YccC
MPTAVLLRPIRRWSMTLAAASYDRLSGSDPGLIRLRSAAGVVASVALTAIVLLVLGFPPSAVVMAGSMAMFVSSSPAMPSDPRRQVVALALTPIPVAISLTVATLLSPNRIVQDLAFLAVIFSAVYIRRIDRYGAVLSVPAFAAFFFASFLGATPELLPELLAAVGIGLLVVALVRLVVLRRRSARTFQRVRRGFQARLGLLLDATADLFAEQPDEHAYRRLSRRERQLHESALMVEAELDALAATGDEDAEPRLVRVHGLGTFDETTWQRRFLAVELASERLAAEARRIVASGLSTEDCTVVLERLGALIALLRADRQRGGRGVLVVPDWVTDPALRDRDGSPRVRGVLWLAAELAATIARGRRGEVPGFAGPAEPALPEVPEPATPGLVGRLRPSTRQAVQATLACGVAILAGELLSPYRWYWAVITAFMVFAGTDSSGETLLKGVRRVAGTLIGIVAGTLVATAAAGTLPLVVVLLFVGMFAAFYLSAISHGLMVFFITITLGLLYSLLGTFTTGLLVLRLEETAIGAAAGAVAALGVLPTSSKHLLRQQMAALLERLAGFVVSTVDCMVDGEQVNLVDGARELDAELDALRRTAEPLTHRINPRRSDTRRLMNLLETCAYHARGIASNAEVAAVPANAELAEAGRRIAGNLRRLLPVLRDRRAGEPMVAGESLVTIAESAEWHDRTRRALEHLGQLDQAVLAFGRSAGVDSRT